MYVNIDVLTLFPEQFSGVFEHSIIKRARDKFLAEIKIHNLRDWAADKYKSVDDRPYGGGAGMILRVDIIDKAVEKLKILAKPARLSCWMRGEPGLIRKKRLI